MNIDIIGLLTVFVLSVFVGYEVISKVPSTLHTPLMSGTNAVHGIIIIGSIDILSSSHGPVQIALGVIAVFLATLNVVGGFVVTDRMLEMFSVKKPSVKSVEKTEESPKQ
jgi:NAD(P) transhydrogenase subunit alpha